MIARDLRSTLLVRRAISPVSESGNTAIEGQVIDRLGYGSLLFAIALGSLGDSDATFTTLVEHGDASDSLSAVGDDQLSGTEANASFQYDNDNAVRSIGYIGNKRYVKLTITPANNSSAALVSAVALLGDPHNSPVSQSEPA